MRPHSADEPRIVRSVTQVQRAHDLIVGILCDETMRTALVGDGDEGKRTLANMACVADVLCWLLGHQDGDGFASNMIVLEATLEAEGFVLRDSMEETNGPAN